MRLNKLCKLSLAAYSLVLLWGIASAKSANADTTWLAKADSCATFSQGLNSHLKSLSLANLSSDERKELAIVLKEACGPRYSSCGFQICGVKKEEPKNVELRREANVKQASRAALVSANPLWWIEKPLSCELLVDQVYARYAPLGPVDNLPTEKREELKEVSKIMCSERFSHCRFSRCREFFEGTLSSALELVDDASLSANGGAESLAAEKENLTPPATLTEDARKHLSYLVSRRGESQKASIAKQIAKEEREGLVWTTRKVSEPTSRIASTTESPGGSRARLRSNGAQSNPAPTFEPKVESGPGLLGTTGFNFQ